MEKFEYGTKTKELREKENVSQRMLAEAIGVTRSAINQFEQQYDIIPIKRLNQIANFFNVSIDYLLGLSKTKKYQDSREEINIDLSAARMKAFRKDIKLSQEKLAKSLNISRSIFAFHENKRTVIGTPSLYQLCAKYGLSADYILGKTNYPKYLKKKPTNKLN